MRISKHPLIRRSKNSLAKGFTLIELVLVIVVLGIIATMVSSFISFGSQIYVESANRDDLTATGRFAIERLNREIRSALPNSIRVTANSTLTRHCIEFTPIETSAVYLDIPVFPEAVNDTITLISARDFSDPALSLSRVAVYPLNESEVYNDAGKIFTVDALTGSSPEWTLTLNENVHFTADSPTQRLYFINTPVAYCVINENNTIELKRHAGGYSYNSDTQPSNSGVLMAEYLQLDFLPFKVTEATQTRNATVLVQFKFTRNFEDIYFNNEIRVPNVP